MTNEIDSKTDSKTDSYLETLLWSETLMSEHGDGISVHDERLASYGCDFEDGCPLDSILSVSELVEIAPEVAKEALADLEGFAHYVEEKLGFDPFLEFDEIQVAHDFCLSRNGHGAGFFDGGDYQAEETEELKALAEQAGWNGVARLESGKYEVGEALQDAARTFGNQSLQVWTDESGKVSAEVCG